MSYNQLKWLKVTFVVVGVIAATVLVVALCQLVPARPVPTVPSVGTSDELRKAHWRVRCSELARQADEVALVALQELAATELAAGAAKAAETQEARDAGLWDVAASAAVLDGLKKKMTTIVAAIEDAAHQAADDPVTRRDPDAEEAVRVVTRRQFQVGVVARVATEILGDVRRVHLEYPLAPDASDAAAK